MSVSPSSSSGSSSCSRISQRSLVARGGETYQTSIMDDDDESLELSLDDFKKKFLGTGLDCFEDLVALAAPAYSEFASRVVEESSDVVTESIRILNELSKLYQEHKRIPTAQRIAFVDHSHAALVCHPRASTTIRPRVVAVPAHISESWMCSPSSSIAWHHVAATVHIHPGMDEDHPFEECNECIGVLHQARPDLSGCFSLTMSRWTFRLVWGDPGTIHASEALKWSDPASLFFALGFIHRIHCPFLSDPTIRLETSSDCDNRTQAANEQVELHGRPPVWLIGDNKGGVYRAATVLSVGRPWTSLNRVVAATQYRPPGEIDFSNCSRTVIKDAWRGRGEEPFCENAILQHIQADGDIPGVCKLISAFIVAGAETLSLPEFDITGYCKHRLILDGTSTPLYDCTSPVDFLMVMYDTLEVLKYVHEQRGVLHRDVSIRNILRSSTTCTSTAEGLKFSGDILGYKYPTLRSGPSCTLIDFDIAYWAGKTPECSLKEPVGTATFAARAVSQSFQYFSRSRPLPFQPLTGNALECYVHAYGDARYNDISALHADRKRLDEDDVRPERAIFSPRHDAESCFWVIVHFLMTALPAGADPTEGDLLTTQILCSRIETHRVGTIIDSRESIFELPACDWSRALHPSLQRYGRLIYYLATVVQPIYEYFDPPLADYHLHEAMQRILLQEICAALDSRDDVALDTHQRRSVKSAFIRHPSAPSGRSSKKRQRSNSLNSRANIVSPAHRRRLS